MRGHAQPLSPAFDHPGDAPLDRILPLLRRLEAGVQDIRDRLEQPTKLYYTPEEFGDLVGRSAYTARRWIAEDRISAIRVQGTGPRGRLLIPREELEKVIASGCGAQIPAVSTTAGHEPDAKAGHSRSRQTKARTNHSTPNRVAK